MNESKLNNNWTIFKDTKYMSSDKLLELENKVNNLDVVQMTELKNKYKRIDIHVFKDTDIDEDTSQFDKIADISMEFPYYVETVKDLIKKIVEVVPEMSLLKDDIEYIETIKDEFSLLCCECKRDYTPILTTEKGFQTEENYSYYLRLYAIIEHDFMNTDKCSMNKDIFNANFKIVRNYLHSCEQCDRHDTCSYVKTLRDKLKKIKSCMSQLEIQKAISLE